ncbi:MAG: proprotein convertase P-domain-containing protein [Deltaproteobacteria bacterium]|nr:proprotein convertase P-domain-containing protein [Deltaproteobacteria bacterium]
MTRIATLVALGVLSSAAHADNFIATRRMPVVEVSHTVDVRIADGIATYTVRRVFSNPGKVADQVELELGLPYGAAATGLRIKAHDRWYTGELMEREAAAKLYEQMTGYGAHAPKDPALLAWMWADTLSLQIFPVMPGSTSTVEYTLTAPTRYEGGRYFISYPRLAALSEIDAENATRPLATPVLTVRPGWGGADLPIVVDGVRVKAGAPIELRPPVHQPWEEAIGVDASASYVSSALEVPSERRTARTFARATVTMDIRHTYKSDLRVELLTPAGEKVEVYDGTGGSANDVRGTFALDLPAKTTGAGTWRLVVSDHAGLDTGTLDKWSLTLDEGGARTVVDAKDTPIFIPDAPANPTEGGVATVAIEPPPMTMLAARLGKVVASSQHAFSRLELDVAPQLVPTPKHAQVVFVVDASYSIGLEALRGQLDVLQAYATHVPDAEIEVVTYRRHATRVFGSFVPAAKLVTAIADAQARGAFALGNGSALDEGARLATSLLRDRKGPRRIVLATDQLVRSALTEPLAQAALAALPKDVVVHVIVPAVDGDDRPQLDRHDDAPFAALATQHHGIDVTVTGLPARTIKELAPPVLELVRPTRLEKAAVTGFALDSDVLHEGAGVRLMIDTLAKPAPDRVTLTGTLWSDPYRKVIPVGAPFSIATAAFVFGADEYHDLSEAEQMVVALKGRAVSPVTSYVAAEPGTRPSTIGLLRGGLLGHGSYGTVGHGYGGGGMTARHKPDFRRLIDTAACVASVKPTAPWSATLEIETTRHELVDAQPDAHSPMADCLVETAWNLRLDPGMFPLEHESFTVELAGTAAP